MKNISIILLFYFFHFCPHEAISFNVDSVPDQLGSGDGHARSKRDTGSSPVVYISDGGLKGLRSYTVKNRAYFAFLGIPYAHPPVGTLRFAAPVKNSPWGGVRDATKPTPMCIQADPLNSYQVKGQEDCLYLNVYTPKLIEQAYGGVLMPVVVAIHPGGFSSGHADYFGPKLLLDQSVVLVTINYRLGPFGFLYTADRSFSGNNGLKDQVMALNWVKSNIMQFGGDPNKVTILGTGSGSASVHYHMVSPMAKNLFHRAIMQSGSAFCTWAFNEDALATTKKLASLLQCPTTDSHKMVDCLRSKEAAKLPAVHTKMHEWGSFPRGVWGPYIDGVYLPEHPETIYKKNGAAKVPVIMGFNSHEGAIHAISILGSKKLISEFNDNRMWESVVGRATLMLSHHYNASEVARISKTARKKYFGSNELAYTNRMSAVQMFSDRYCTVCTLRAMHYHVKYTQSSVYCYEFSYLGKHSIIHHMGLNPEDWGVTQMDNDVYLFDNDNLWGCLKSTEKDYEMARVMVDLWTTFASNGVPFLTSNKGAHEHIWKPNLPDTTYEGDNLKCLNLKLYPEPMENHYKDTESFWAKLYLVKEGTYETTPSYKHY